MKYIRSSYLVPCQALLITWLCSVGGTTAKATQIDWASTVISSTVADASGGLGRPDTVEVSSLSVHQVMTFGGFGAGQTDNFTTAALASFLGVSSTVLANADFIVFEHNGAPHIPFETSTWTFSDGVNQLVAPYSSGSSASGPVSALGNISPSAYASFFSTSIIPSGDWAFILFDIDGSSSVNLSSSTFQVTMNGPGDTSGHPGSPDPDAFGRINSVPEGSLFAPALLGLTTLSMVAFRRKVLPR